MSRSWAGTAAVGLALLLAGCGARPAAVPQLIRPAAPQGFHALTYRGAGVRLDAPRSWTISSQSLPLVTVINSGGAVISLWRYPRSGAPPATQAWLHHRDRHLVAAAHDRQPSLHILGDALGSVDGHPSIQLDATETIGASQRRVRSIHVFAPTTELVLEEYAPPSLFERVSRQVFARVARSLVILAR